VPPPKSIQELVRGEKKHRKSDAVKKTVGGDAGNIMPAAQLTTLEKQDQAEQHKLAEAEVQVAKLAGQTHTKLEELNEDKGNAMQALLRERSNSLQARDDTCKKLQEELDKTKFALQNSSKKADAWTLADCHCFLVDDYRFKTKDGKVLSQALTLSETATQAEFELCLEKGFFDDLDVRHVEIMTELSEHGKKKWSELLHTAKQVREAGDNTKVASPVTPATRQAASPGQKALAKDLFASPGDSKANTPQDVVPAVAHNNDDGKLAAEMQQKADEQMQKKRQEDEEASAKFIAELLARELGSAGPKQAVDATPEIQKAKELSTITKEHEDRARVGGEDFSKSACSTIAPSGAPQSQHIPAELSIEEYNCLKHKAFATVTKLLNAEKTSAEVVALNDEAAALHMARKKKDVVAMGSRILKSLMDDAVEQKKKDLQGNPYELIDVEADGKKGANKEKEKKGANKEKEKNTDTEKEKKVDTQKEKKGGKEKEKKGGKEKEKANQEKEKKKKKKKKRKRESVPSDSSLFGEASSSDSEEN
jgi:hypothetical protein